MDRTNPELAHLRQLELEQLDRFDGGAGDAAQQRLGLYSPQHFDTEYAEASAHVRTSHSLRTDIAKVWLQTNGILVGILGYFLTHMSQNLALSRVVVVAIAQLGLLASAYAFILEQRSYRYYVEVCHRGRVLEACAGFYGTFWRAYIEAANSKRRQSRLSVFWIAAAFGAAFWLMIALVVLLSMQGLPAPE